MKYDVIVLGSGASGVMTTLTCKNKKIALIDRSNKVAKKLLVTGNGRCNLTNINMSSEYYNQNIDKFLTKFNINQTLDFFSKLGLVFYSDEEGRVYPLSNSAKSVVDVITNKIENSNVDLYLEHEILSFQKKEDYFLVKTDKAEFECEKLVVALGGNVMLNFAKEMGLSVKDVSPSLVSLKTNSTKYLNNTRVSNVLVKAVNSRGEERSEKGEILFKESGLSGICIFNLSSLFSRINDFNGNLIIDFMPDYNHDKLINLLKQRKNLNVKINKFFDGLFSPPIAYEILNRCKVNEDRQSSKLDDSEIEKFAKVIKNLTFDVNGCYENNQIFSGGILLDELNENLECKKIKDLYFCGEICDVDGLCGGYNLQWAWTSGHIVGENL